MTTTPEGSEPPAAEPEPAAAPTPAVPAPVRGLDPQISLATAVHAAPGVYALLLGSGISSAAGIPTGWAIVNDLVRRAAAAAAPGEDVGEVDPEAWWAANGDGSALGYSGLLGALGATPAARDQNLRRYFDASNEDRAEGRKLPTAAHEAIADLVAAGYFRVILTTNFDRLLERALEQRGIQPQVIHRSEQIPAMIPLTHAAVTIIKLHGDYADLDKRNTVDELAEYPPPTAALLARVLDEYGLIVCGWSGEWDIALVHALEEARARRYPLFWSSYATPTEGGSRLIAQTGATLVEGVGADALFAGLGQRLDALDRLSSPPLSRELAVTRLKRALPDPVRRIDTHDLVMDEVARLRASMADGDRYPTFAGGDNAAVWAQTDASLHQYRADSDTLLHLLAAGAYYGGPDHLSLWTTAIGRLMAPPPLASGRTFQTLLVNIRRYPALLAAITLLTTVGVAPEPDDRLVAAVLRRPQAPGQEGQSRAASYVLHPWRVFDQDAANQLPRWNGQRWLHPPSHLLRVELDDVVAAYEPDAERRKLAFDRAEYLMGLAQVAAGDVPWTGESVLRLQYSQEPLPAAAAARSEVDVGTSPLLSDLFDGDRGRAVQGLDALDAALVEASRRF